MHGQREMDKLDIVIGLSDFIIIVIKGKFLLLTASQMRVFFGRGAVVGCKINLF